MNYIEEFNAKRAAARKAILETRTFDDADAVPAALVLLHAGERLEEVNRLLSGQAIPLAPRGLDLQVFYTILRYKDRGLSAEAAAFVAALCGRHYGLCLPPYTSIEREFNPWDYELCNCPTENHLFNDCSCRLAQCVLFPEAVFSDGHTAAEYRLYWEDAFRRLVAARIRRGLREWRSPIYCHVIFDDAIMLYNIMPDGPTREAARVFLDYLFLSIALTLRGHLWTGPHSRVYLENGPRVPIEFHQCYSGYAAQLLQEHFLRGIITSDYVIPEAIARLPFRQDRYVSIEKVGPKFYPRGEGQGRFSSGGADVYICRSDREDWGGDGILYNYLTPLYGLGSVQDWGPYDGEFHMHCVPWNLMLKCDDCRDIVFSYAGSHEEASRQGGHLTWGNQSDDQDGTIFQRRKTIFSQLRGWYHEKIYEVLWDGYPEAPWAPAPAKRLMGFVGEKRFFATRIFVAGSIANVIVEGGWIFGEKGGVCFAVRPVRGGFHVEQDEPGNRRVYQCAIWDDVVLLEVGETADFGGFGNFRSRILAAPLRFDEKTVAFTNLEGEALTFCWKEEGDPTVNGVVPVYGGKRFNDPCVQSDYDSGVIRVNCRAAAVTLNAAG